MLVPNSKKRHPEFDLEEARKVFVKAGADKDLCGERITSPYHLFAVETLRDRHAVRSGVPVPTDVFVMGKGEAPRRDCTKIGGKPYWPANRPWPRKPDDNPYRFLAQFNFVDSKDLFPNLPGDVLLIFADDGEDWYWDPAQAIFEWMPLGLDYQEEFPPSLTSKYEGRFFGAIHRTADYPAFIQPYWKVPPELFEVGIQRLPLLDATKIGGVGYDPVNQPPTPGLFLCRMASIQPEPFMPFPWVNDPNPVDLKRIYSPDNEICIWDMRGICFFLQDDGTIITRVGS